MVWIALVLTGVMTGIAAGPVLHLLPEPTTTEPKRPYRDLATVGFTALVTACSVLALGVVAARLPAEAWPTWIPLATVGVLLAVIDAMTTYLPYRLTVALWLFGLAGVGVSVALSDEPASLLMRIALGAIGAWAFFWLFWRLSRGIGFGDVRLAPSSAVSPPACPETWFWRACSSGRCWARPTACCSAHAARAGHFPMGPPS